MGWLASLISFASSQSSRKGQAFSSTSDAFSLPTSSPVVSSHPDAFNVDMLNNPEPESATTQTSYTYPPPGGGSYGYVPTSASLTPRSPSLLPLHNQSSILPSHSLNYPTLSQTWNRLRAWLGREYPELGDTLNYGILPQDLAQIEMQFGFTLPPAVRESYLIVDGQEAESAAGCSEGLFFGLTLLPLEDVLEEWRFWREVDEDPTTGSNLRLRDLMKSIPPGWVRTDYSQRGWIPLIADKAGNYVGVDLNPGEGGTVGQVIVFGREFDTKVVMWKGDGLAGWAKWLASFVEELESGEGYEIGPGNEASEGSEDGVGYESYFHDGNGRGQGDSGGESGTGGMRLTGEYRGWNTLDAWADRSLRKWYEHGAIPESELLSEGKDKVKENIDVLKRGSDAEVPIPVLADIENEGTTALGDVTNTVSRLPLPTISVTKPPAPLPVALPTPYDIGAPSSPHSPADSDLEAGHNLSMRDISHEQETTSIPPLISQHFGGHENTMGLVSPSTIPLPTSPAPVPPLDLTEHLTLPLAPVAPLTNIHDFLADPDPVLETTPIQPTAPAQAKLPEFSSVEQILFNELEANPQGTSDFVADSIEDDTPSNSNQDVTIRLVGGGGTAGTTLPDDDVNGEVQPDVAATSVTLNTLKDPSMKKGAKNPEQKKSAMSGLRKLGHLSGLRKNNSSSSLKDMV